MLQCAPRRRTFGAGLVARARLVRRLMDARDLPLAVLTAPAGYGKTTLLLDWAQRDRRPFAWVALDRADDDPDRLLTAVARATGALPQRGSASVLVLDGVEAVRSPGAVEAMAGLVARPPVGAQLVLASRCEPSLPLGRLRVQRELLELTTRDFIMTRGEAAELLARAGLALGAAQVDALVARTEGWPAGLYLAALSLRDRHDVAIAVSEFGGDDRLVADYIADAVLADLSEDQVSFLTRTSVLERASGPLCDAVLRTRGAAMSLKSLARANVPLATLDRTDEWYRYHGMFAQALRAELRRREPGLDVELHGRASRWHAAHGDVDVAVRHAAAAGDVRIAGDLLRTHVLRYIAAGQTDTVERLLALFTEEQTASYAPLALVAASVHLALGDRDLAEHWTLVAADTETCPPGVAIVRAAIARDGVARMRVDAAHAYELDTEASPWRPLARHLEGTACHLLGERERARTLLRDGARAGLVTTPAISALCLAQLALLASESGDRHDSGELATRARVQLERLRLIDEPGACLVLAASALAKAELGQVETARRDADRTARQLARLADVAPWYRAEVGIVLARAMAQLADIAEARALLDHAADALRGAPDAVVLGAWLEETRAQLDDATPRSLTGAELRILRMLPTHLSFREIGSQLYVSSNTVKTQAQAVYRKLDASSRSEAVARARELGLLDVSPGAPSR